MKRTLIIVTVVAVAAAAIAGALYGHDLMVGMRYEKAMFQIGEADKANAGAWPQTQETCFVCHGPHGQSLNAWYPALSGQPKAYIAAQLHAFANDQRPNPYMGPLAKEMSDAHITEVTRLFGDFAQADVVTVLDKDGKEVGRHVLRDGEAEPAVPAVPKRRAKKAEAEPSTES